jgi:hypothetical protein
MVQAPSFSSQLNKDSWISYLTMGVVEEMIGAPFCMLIDILAVQPCYDVSFGCSVMVGRERRLCV